MHISWTTIAAPTRVFLHHCFQKVCESRNVHLRGFKSTYSNAYVPYEAVVHLKRCAKTPPFPTHYDAYQLDIYSGPYARISAPCFQKKVCERKMYICEVSNQRIATFK